MRTLAMLSVLALIAVGSAEDKKADTNFDGGYTIVSGEKDGQALPEGHVKGTTVKFKGDKITTLDKDSKEVYVTTFKANSKKANLFDFKTTVPKEAEAVGMIEKTGDEIKLIYALPGGDAPTEFKTKKGQQMFLLKNMNKKGNK